MPFGMQKKEKLSTADMIKQHRATIIIVGIALVLVLVQRVDVAMNSRANYDVMVLSEQTDFSSAKADEVPFLRKVASVNHDVQAALLSGSGDAKPVLVDAWNELLKTDVPASLTNVKAAELDLLRIFNKSDVYDQERLDKAKKDLSIEITKILG